MNTQKSSSPLWMWGVIVILGVLVLVLTTKLRQSGRYNKSGASNAAVDFNTYNINRDNIIDEQDMTLLLQAVGGLAICPSNVSCDINGDGKLSTTDLIMMRRFIINRYDYDGDVALTDADVKILLSVVGGAAGSSCPADKVCDINGDGKLSTTDLTRLQKMVKYFTATVYDLNRDNIIDEQDMTLLLRVVGGLAGYSCPDGVLCDINNDGKLSTTDLITMKRFAINRYDYNGDGALTDADAKILLRVVGGLAGTSCPTSKVCDINADGKLSTTDLLRMQRIVTYFKTASF